MLLQFVPARSGLIGSSSPNFPLDCQMMPLEKNSSPISFKGLAHHGRHALLRSIAIGVITALAIMAANVGCDWLAERHDIAMQSMWLADAALATVAGLLVGKMIRNSDREKRRIFHRLLMIAEMNHNIRNSLEVIQLSAHVSQDKEAIQEIDTAVNRIHWALKEFVPAEPALSALPVQASVASTGTDDSCIVARGQRKS